MGGTDKCTHLSVKLPASHRQANMPANATLVERKIPHLEHGLPLCWLSSEEERMNRLLLVRCCCVIAGVILLWEESRLGSQGFAAPPGQPSPLVFSCAADNDLFQALTRGGAKPARCDSAEQAIERAEPHSGVLVLADGYPKEGTRISEDLIKKIKSKKLQVYIEYPATFPGCMFGKPREAKWERAVVVAAEEPLALPAQRLLAVHDASFLPTEARHPLLVLARVAGFDTAVYGLPEERFPLLFEAEEGIFVATSKLSGFVTARFAPAKVWGDLWKSILKRLDPAGSPHALVFEPTVRPAFGKDEPLPADASRAALSRFALWFRNSGLLITPGREAEIRDLLRSGAEVTKMPAHREPAGDGSLGILEGYESQIHPDGSQLQRVPIRADCQAESALMLALHASIERDPKSQAIAENLLNYLYVTSELHQGKRGNPHHPAFGLISWGAVAPAWQVANYGDDNARTLLATILAATSLQSDAWDEAVLKGLLANLRTTGSLGFRGDRIDLPQLEERGWKAYHEGRHTNNSPHFEAYLWACYLWAYARTGEREFLDKTKTGIRMTMAVYPEGWRLGDNAERSRMILALAWLVRVEDTEEHRRWLRRIAHDLLKHQQPCGAIPERLSRLAGGGYAVPTSNEAYGTSETPLIQKNGDPVSDQLYTTGFALFGLHEAAAATHDPQLKEAVDRLSEYMIRIQTRCAKRPELDGTWFRAFDYDQWDCWASSADVGWGAWCLETGWGQVWAGATLGLRLQQTSFWDFTASSKINLKLPEVRKQMSVNQGLPFSAR